MIRWCCSSPHAKRKLQLILIFVGPSDGLRMGLYKRDVEVRTTMDTINGLVHIYNHPKTSVTLYNILFICFVLFCGSTEFNYT